MKTISREELIETMAARSTMSKYEVEEFLECYEKTISSLLTGFENGVWHRNEDRDFREDVRIRIANGIYITRKFVPEKEQAYGVLKGKTIPEHCNIKASVSAYYADGVNERIENMKDTGWYRHITK